MLDGAESCCMHCIPGARSVHVIPRDVNAGRHRCHCHRRPYDAYKDVQCDVHFLSAHKPVAPLEVNVASLRTIRVAKHQTNFRNTFDTRKLPGAQTSNLSLWLFTFYPFLAISCLYAAETYQEKAFAHEIARPYLRYHVYDITNRSGCGTQHNIECTRTSNHVLQR